MYNLINGLVSLSNVNTDISAYNVNQLNCVTKWILYVATNSSTFNDICSYSYLTIYLFNHILNN